jgi:hypothetical protein
MVDVIDNTGVTDLILPGYSYLADTDTTAQFVLYGFLAL